MEGVTFPGGAEAGFFAAQRYVKELTSCGFSVFIQGIGSGNGTELIYAAISEIVIGPVDRYDAPVDRDRIRLRLILRAERNVVCGRNVIGDFVFGGIEDGRDLGYPAARYALYSEIPGDRLPVHCRRL